MTSQIHNVQSEEVYGLLRTRPDGLTRAEALERLRELGPNKLEAARQFRAWRSLARQFTNFFSILLDISAVLCFVADRMQPGEGMQLLGAALLGVSVLNALFSFLQEARAERAMEELRKFLPPRVIVWRHGAEMEVLAEEVVPGDVLLVAEGTRIPADARLVQSDGLLVDNAPLTGESRPIELSAAASEARFVESPNILFAGCSVLRGSGRAVVFATGRRTEFGKIAAMSVEIRRPASPLERETARMVRVLTVIAVSMGVLFFAYGVVAGRSPWVSLVFMLGIIVANVPEGLLPTFTLALAVGGLRLARKKVLVKSLNAVEALGSVQVICTDKTGTLTQNRLAITRVVSAAAGEPLQANPRQQVLAAGLLASELHERKGHVTGDPLDVALARAYADDPEQGLAIARTAERHYPFDVNKRRAGGLGRLGGQLAFSVKGAWEALRPLVTKVVSETGASEDTIDEQRLARIDKVVHELASEGERVIAVASRSYTGALDSAEQDELERELVLLGFVCLDDPIRPEVPEAMVNCQRAGIRVVLITGDHPDTAQTLAKRAKLQGAEVEPVMIGAQLEQLKQSELMTALDRGTSIFARTTPEQKMKIVSALKELGLIVAMTGDGVNDAPALKAADVGVAMGEHGTDVAREAAQIVLLDDNFASIVAGIEEGRAIFDNIKKFTNYVLVSNGPEILPYLLYIVFPVPLALTVIQILAIDLGTDIVPSMALGQEPPDRDVMRRPPRSRNERLLTRSLIAHSYGFLGLIEAGYALFLFFLVLVQGGWQWGQDLASSDPLYRSATGICLCTIVLMQIGNFIGRRSRDGSGLDGNLLANRLTVAGFALEIAFAYSVLYLEPMQKVFGTGPVSGTVFLLAVLGAPLIFVADYARKRVRQSLSLRRAAML